MKLGNSGWSTPQNLKNIKGTLRRFNWEPFLVSAVIVEKVILLHPCELVHLMCVKALISWLLPPVVDCSDAIGGVSVLYLASIHTETFVCCNKWCHCPVQFHPPIVSRPVLPVPDCAVDSHWLGVGVCNANVLVVLENTDWSIVHIESAGGQKLGYNMPQFELLQFSVYLCSNAINLLKFVSVCSAGQYYQIKFIIKRGQFY